MANYRIREIKLLDAIREVESGNLQLPEFQRNYVWKPTNQIALVDSIQKGYPVGALLLLEVDASDATGGPFGFRPFEGAPAPVSPLKYLVLDGQQRLTTTFRVFSPNVQGVKKIYVLDLVALFERTGGASDLSVDFADLVNATAKVPHLEVLLLNKNLLPLSFLTLEKKDLRKKLDDYALALAAEASREDYAKFIRVSLHSYLDAFFDYQFPCVVLPANLDLEAVSNVFTKLNTSGLVLSAFDLCVSKLFPQGVYLRTLWNDAKSRDSIKLLDKDGTSILQTVSLLSGLAPKKAGLVKVIEKYHIDTNWGKSIAGLDRLNVILKKIGASVAKTLPYDTIAPSLAAILTQLPLPTNPPQIMNEIAKVERWVLQTAFNQRYTEGTETKKDIDYRDGLKWFLNNVTPDFLNEPVQWSDSLSLNTSNSGARASAILMLLNKNGTRDFILEKQIGLGLNGVSDAQIHHIFPTAYLRSVRAAPEDKNLSNRAFNMTFLTGESNNFISDEAPSNYVEKMKTRLIEEIGLTEAEAEIRIIGIFNTHFIDETALACLRDDDYEGFLVARGKAFARQLTLHGIPVSEVGSSPEVEDESTVDSDESEIG